MKKTVTVLNITKDVYIENSNIVETLKNDIKHYGPWEVELHINHTMVEYIEQLLELIGEDYRPCIHTTSDVKHGFVDIYTRDNADRYHKTLTRRFLVDDTTFDKTELDNEVLTNKSISYLVMNRLTLCHFKSRKLTDDYGGSAYYQSYHKIPIAISELTDFGKIDILS
jgi:hypothetical protein